ncbi:MAG: heparan-alpha-glucosaminide N-acetyltransferase domain-containing protein, partial [Candidatus Saccharibacteria bacterium]
MTKKDPTLDILKGIACILMVSAHVTQGHKGIAVYGYINMLCGLAAVLFAGVSGATSFLQAQTSKATKEVVTKYIWLFILAVSLTGLQVWNYMNAHNLLRFSNVLQFLFLGSLICFLIYRKTDKTWICVVIAGAIFAIHFVGMGYVGSHAPLKAFLFYDGDTTYSLV